MEDKKNNKSIKHSREDADDSLAPSDNFLDDEEVVLGDRSVGGRLESFYYSVVSHTTADGRVIFGNNEIELFPNKEMPEYASPGTKAYAARDLDSNIEYIVMLCGRHSLPRLSSIGSYRNLRTPHVLRLIAAGVVNWNLEGRQRFALIFERPEGRRILKTPEDKVLQVKTSLIVDHIINPVLEVLQNLQSIDLVHGAIRLENMFLRVTEDNFAFKLGECISSPASMYQGSIYETPLRAMVDPHKRGIGTIQDDLYALGVCAAQLAKGENLSITKTDSKMITSKLEQGSCAALIGKESFADGLGEFLRGVLHHDIKQRWDLDDCIKWSEGRRVNPKKALYNTQSQRPFMIKDDEFFNLSLIANEFAKDPKEMSAHMSKGGFVQWLRRNFDDKDLKTRFDEAYQKSADLDLDRYVCNICMAIDPFGPIRYKGINLFPQGFGVALARSVKSGESLNVYGDFVKNQILSSWVNQIYENIHDAAGMISLFEKCRIALNQRIYGYGLERVLYIANPGMPCMSPYLEKHYVLIPGGILLALEDLSAKSNRPDMILDRHMAAFLSVRESKLIDPHLGYINSSDAGRRVIGILRTLNSIQKRFAVGSVPGVTKWISSLLQPTIDEFKDKDLKEKIVKEVSRAQGSGNLQKIVNLIDDPYVVQEDKRRFNYARAEYYNLMLEKDKIEDYLKMRSTFGRSTGRQVAMIVSSVIALVTIFLYSFIFFSSKM